MQLCFRIPPCIARRAAPHLPDFFPATLQRLKFTYPNRYVPDVTVQQGVHLAAVVRPVDEAQ